LEIESGQTQDLNRIRKPGGGRNKLIENQSDILDSLKNILEPSTFGCSEKLLIWTLKSRRKLARELNNQGFEISYVTVGDLLEILGYSLQVNKKSIEGNQDQPDRNAQFEFINKKMKSFQDAGLPVLSVDCKKKELVGNYKNPGRIYRLNKNPEKVKVYDFIDKQQGKANPYGVYDVTQNVGFINLGIDHDTAQFAVESIRRWYKKLGANQYPSATKILLTADGGGSNGSRNRLWKFELQKLASELGIEIHVCHLPPGTSKWNKIEHRLFAQISRNWSGIPLRSHEIIRDLIVSTTTETGLEVHYEMDRNLYPLKIKVSDEELAKLNIKFYKFRGEWNYKIKPEKIKNCRN
jgi:hypothetical protein